MIHIIEDTKDDVWKYIVIKDTTRKTLRAGKIDYWFENLRFSDDLTFLENPNHDQTLDEYLKSHPGLRLLLSVETEEELFNLSDTHPELFI